MEMAQVSLTIGGLEGFPLDDLGIAQPGAAVTIQRRVSRNGYSEYFLNNTPCQVDDVRRLCLAIGLQQRRFSIINQDDVGKLLSDDSEIRRFIFDEAAGVRGHKLQRAEAVRKLNYTEQNLERVNDLVQEVRRQIGSLERQTAKARRYRQISTELRDVEIRLAVSRREELSARLRGAESARDEAGRQLEMCRTALNQTHQDILQLRSLYLAHTDLIAQSQQRCHDINLALVRFQTRLEFEKQDHTGPEASLPGDSVQAVQGSKEIAQLRCDSKDAELSLREFQSNKSQLETELSRLDERILTLLSEVEEFWRIRASYQENAIRCSCTLQALQERMKEKYRIDLNALRAESHTLTELDFKEATGSSARQDIDHSAVISVIHDLQKRLDDLGPVNLTALEEYEETTQRYEFLARQQKDLDEAKKQLQNLIQTITSQSREAFTRTFTLIRNNFQKMFKEAFGGGQADIILDNEDDILRSKIDIVVRPPGKEFQSISLLSAGEQTMTAIALLLSANSVKPSPFYVIDELDAPLDELSTDRFMRLLQRFMPRSQFIIISHNKKTVSFAQEMYGITMQERGVSKLVKVRVFAAEGKGSNLPDLEKNPVGRLALAAQKEMTHEEFVRRLLIGHVPAVPRTLKFGKLVVRMGQN